MAEAVMQKAFKMLPARPGCCSVCASNHPAHHAHNLHSLAYGVHFRLRWGRDPTWADACAHLTDDERDNWRDAMMTVGQEWTEPDGDPIREPYAVVE